MFHVKPHERPSGTALTDNDHRGKTDSRRIIDGRRIPLSTRGFSLKTSGRIDASKHHNDSDGAFFSYSDITGRVDRYGSFGRSAPQTSHAHRCICGARGAGEWLRPGMSEDGSTLPLFPFPPGFCGLRVKHIFHHYVARETGAVYACAGRSSARPSDQHVRGPVPAPRQSPPPPDAHLIHG